MIGQDNLFSAINDFNQMKNKQTAVVLCIYARQVQQVQTLSQ